MPGRGRRFHRFQSAATLLWIHGAGCLALPPAFIGAKVCGSCHPAIAARQSRSAHATALFPASSHPLADAFPAGKTLIRPPGYRFNLFREHGELTIKIQDAEDRMELPLEWAFGSGHQAVTFVTRVNRDWYLEHFASFYPALRNWAATPGQDALKPTTLAESAGVMYQVADPLNGIAGCFECHSTGPVSFNREGQATLTEAGVHCESCHGAGSSHAADPARNRLANPANLTASKLSDFCGQCHRPPATTGVHIDWNYAWNVRHQPIYLNESACFRKSRGALSCLTCHDPHEPAAKKPAAFYNDRCAACHTRDAHPPKASCATNCVDCHMPLVSPQPPLRFTNHWIGIYKPGAMLRPVSRR